MALDLLSIRSERIARRDVDAATRAAMRELMDRHFLGVTSDVFERDLEEKDHAILLVDGTGALRGFTTLAIGRATHAGEPLRVVYSGDTVVDAGARSGAALARAWIDALRALCPAAEGTRVIWLLICSSVRTYRFLPVFFRDFIPRREGETPAASRSMLNALAARRYGAAFDASTGIVRLRDPQPLRPARQACDVGPDADWFGSLNPGHAHGDELVCLCDLGDDNLTVAGRRMVSAGERERSARSAGGVR